ncbi:MAG: type II toxin-antitoxin system PemK/MazF family toxin [Pseudomonadota bacterium]
MKIASRGEVWFANLNPAAGREQQGARPVLVVSEKEFNRLGLCVVCPITQGGLQSRYAGFAVTLMGTGCETQGVVMCNQPRTIDLVARSGRFVEAVGEDLMEEVLARLQTVFANGD